MHVLSDLQQGPIGHRLPGLHVKPDPDVEIQDGKTGIAELRVEIGQGLTRERSRRKMVDGSVCPPEEPQGLRLCDG